jgi:thiamine-phosphate pyrophosphorylase
VFDLYLITDSQASRGLIETTRLALNGARPGRVGVQLRAKELPTRELLYLGNRLRELTRQAGAVFLINDRVDLVSVIGADGVHLSENGPLPQEARVLLGPNALIGASRHDALGLERARTGGASFATLSPFASSPGKGAPLGAQGFATCARAVDMPIFALGGIDAKNVREAVASGASGVAVIRAVYSAPDPSAAVTALLQELDGARSLYGSD